MGTWVTSKWLSSPASSVSTWLQWSWTRSGRSASSGRWAVRSSRNSSVSVWLVGLATLSPLTASKNLWSGRLCILFHYLIMTGMPLEEHACQTRPKAPQIHLPRDIHTLTTFWCYRLSFVAEYLLKQLPFKNSSCSFSF